MEISDLYNVANIILAHNNAFGIGTALDNLTTNINSFVNNYTNWQPQNQEQQRNRILDLSFTAFEQIKDGVQRFDESLFTIDQLEIFNKYPNVYVLKNLGAASLSSFQDYAKNKNFVFKDDYLKYYNDYKHLINIANQTVNSINALGIQSTFEKLSEDECIFEIIFSNKVEINDFATAKSQAEKWYVIFEGYARFLGKNNSDFQIFDIQKNSPAKFKVKIKKEDIVLFITILSGIIGIETNLLTNYAYIEQTKKNPHINAEIKDTIIRDITQKIDTELDEKLNTLVDEKLKNREIKNGDETIRKALKQSVKNEYKFINNGGEIRIQIGDNNHQDILYELEVSKEKLKQLKDSNIEIKSIDEQSRSSGEEIIEEN